MSNDKPDTITSLKTNGYEERLIIFLDIVGFSNFIKTNQNQEDIHKITKFLEKFSDGLGEGEVNVHGKQIVIKPSKLFFSDTLLFAYPKVYMGDEFCKLLKLDKETGYFHHLLRVIVEIAKLQLHCIEHNLLLRGAIHVGEIHISKDQWFGEGIITAHEYESKIVDVPRIVFTRETHNLLKDELKLHSNLIYEDGDGLYYIDWLGYIHADKRFDDYEKAHIYYRNIIQENLDKLRGKERLFRKWAWLAKSFNNHRNTILNEDSERKLAPECII